MRYLFSFVVAFLFYQCDSKTVEPITPPSQSVTIDTVLPEAYRLALSQIQINLERLSQTQSQLTVSGGEMNKDLLSKINTDIKNINTLLDSNRQTIKRLNARLKQEKEQKAYLSALIDNMNERLLTKEEELNAAREALEEYDAEILFLQSNTGLVNQELNAAQRKNLNYEKGWYVIGNEKMLIDNNVITREGGFLGMGKTTQINQVLNKKKFRVLSIYKTTELPIQALHARLITPHDPESYEWVKERGQIMSLVINDPAKFWSISRYAVVVTD